MPKTRPLPPIVYIEIEANYRWQGLIPVCCYVTVVEQRGTLHRRIAHTEHIHGSPERLVDLVDAKIRELTREYVLYPSAPF